MLECGSCSLMMYIADPNFGGMHGDNSQCYQVDAVWQVKQPVFRIYHHYWDRLSQNVTLAGTLYMAGVAAVV